MVTGERGIGKSSLMVACKWFATGDFQWGDHKYNFIVLDVELATGSTFVGLLRAIGAKLDKEHRKYDGWQEAGKKLVKFISRCEAGGVKLNPKEELKPDYDRDCAELIDELAEAIAECDHALGDRIDGFIVMIDEADKAAVPSQLGLVCKLLTERLPKLRSNRLCLGIAGQLSLPTLLDQTHESARRVFQDLRLDTLKKPDVERVVARALEIANEKNDIKTTISEDALKLIYEFSEGYPHFIQQYGHSAFATDSDDLVDKNDVIVGAFGQNGAIQRLGEVYFEDMYYNQIQTDKYRKVLHALAGPTRPWVKKSELRKKTALSDGILTNALAALKKHGMVKVKKGVKGFYALPNNSFGTWLSLLASNSGQQVIFSQREEE